MEIFFMNFVLRPEINCLKTIEDKRSNSPLFLGYMDLFLVWSPCGFVTSGNKIFFEIYLLQYLSLGYTGLLNPHPNVAYARVLK